MDKSKARLRPLVDEQWREIPDSNGLYFVSNYGRVRSFSSNSPAGDILKGTLISNYKAVQLIINGKAKRLYVHRLVAEVWLSKPSPKHVIVTHIDMNKLNNQPNNLRWITQDESYKIMSDYFGEKYSKPRRRIVTSQSKLKESDVAQLKSMLNRNINKAVISKLFCVSETQVIRIMRGENWGHVKAATL